jgi:LysM repeat protein
LEVDMKKLRFFSGSAALIISLVLVSAVYADTNYVVRYGDTLWRIARSFNVTPEAIVAANPGRIPNINLIYAGDVLVIPTDAPPPTPGPGTGGVPYTVVSGDTLYSLAQRNGTTVALIWQANPQIANPNWIYAGQVITIPSSSGTGSQNPPPTAGNYIVQPGDGLTGIARRYNTTVEVLLQLNPQITNRHLIFVGDRMNVPGG